MITDPEIINSDQTLFSTEEPLFNADRQREIKKGLSPIFLGFALLLTLGVLLTTYQLIFLKDQEEPNIVTISPTPSPPIDLPRIERLLDELKIEIDLSDPTKESIALPPVSEDIFIQR